jgi:hypothetical protein
MTNRCLLLLLLGVLPSAALACASDPNKEANDAHNAELKSERNEKQAAADDKSDRREATAGAQRDMTTANATGSPANKDKIGADAKMKEARDVSRAKATERLEKADARTTELKAIVKRSGAKATTASRDSLNTVDTQRALAKQSIDQLASASNDDWERAKSNTDAQLDTLEGLVKKTSDEVDKFK